jgi:hypothetical protein
MTTPESQRRRAVQLLNEKGRGALDDPHAMTGRKCGCGECFCCVSVQVIAEHDAKMRKYGSALIAALTKACERVAGPRELIEEIELVLAAVRVPHGMTYPLAITSTVGMRTPRRFVKTGQFRAPRKGEYYLSGAIPEAYLAPNDLSTAYAILREVEL